jgi:hypothetical protein
MRLTHLEACELEWAQLVLLQGYKQLEGYFADTRRYLINVSYADVLGLQSNTTHSGGNQLSIIKQITR